MWRDALKRPEGALGFPKILPSLLVIIGCAALWGLLTKSVWVAAISCWVNLVPLWWTPADKEKLSARFGLAILSGGAFAALGILTHKTPLY